mgnify:CR=1 FL=1
MEPKKYIQDYNQGLGIEFSIAVLCYRTEKEIIPFIEKLHQIMNLYHVLYSKIHSVAKYQNYLYYYFELFCKKIDVLLVQNSVFVII